MGNKGERMQKYVIYDNYGTIVDIADTEQEIRQKWKDSKVARILAKSLDKNKEYNMGLAELSEDELKNFGNEYTEE